MSYGQKNIDQLQNLLQQFSFTDQMPLDIWSVDFGYLVGSSLLMNNKCTLCAEYVLTLCISAYFQIAYVFQRNIVNTE